MSKEFLYNSILPINFPQTFFPEKNISFFNYKEPPGTANSPLFASISKTNFLSHKLTFSGQTKLTPPPLSAFRQQPTAF